MNWTKIFNITRNITWILMFVSLLITYYFVSPQYNDYKESKKRFKEEVEKVKNEMGAVKEQRDSIQKLFELRQIDYDNLQKKMNVVNSNLLFNKKQEEKLREDIEKFKKKDDYTNEELETLLNKRFNDIMREYSSTSRDTIGEIGDIQQ